MDPYEILGVAKGCTRQEVREAFLVKARSAHPDHGGDDASFAQLRGAYEQILAQLNGSPGATSQRAAGTFRDDLAPSQADRSVAPERYPDWLFRSSEKTRPKDASRQRTYLRIIVIAIYLSLIILLGWANWLAWTWDPRQAAGMGELQEHNGR
jgi:hypothetical protein